MDQEIINTPKVNDKNFDNEEVNLVVRKKSSSINQLESSDPKDFSDTTNSKCCSIQSCKTFCCKLLILFVGITLGLLLYPLVSPYIKSFLAYIWENITDTINDFFTDSETNQLNDSDQNNYIGDFDEINDDFSY